MVRERLAVHPRLADSFRKKKVMGAHLFKQTNQRQVHNLMIPYLPHNEPYYLCPKLAHSQAPNNWKPSLDTLFKFAHPKISWDALLYHKNTEQALGMLPSFDLLSLMLSNMVPPAADCTFFGKLSRGESSFSGTDLCHHSISSINQHPMGTFCGLTTIVLRGHLWVHFNRICSLLPPSFSF